MLVKVNVLSGTRCRHGAPFLKESKALLVSSISVILTQLEQAMLRFEATNAKTPPPQEKGMKWKSVSFTTRPTSFVCVEEESKVPLRTSLFQAPLDYVEPEWLNLTPGTQGRNAQELMEGKKMWLTLTKEEDNRKAHEKAFQLAKNW